MAPDNGPSVRFRRIGRTLRELREESNRSLRTAGRDLDRSASNLSMIENGLQRVRPRDLAQILDYYGVHDGPLRESLMHLASEGRKKSWAYAFQGKISARSQDFASLEGDSERIRCFQPHRIPGLLQTQAHVRALMGAGPPNPARDEAGLVAFRLKRQEILSRLEPPRFEAVIGEPALHQQVGGPKAMKAQLHHLARLSLQRHIALRVLPRSMGALASGTCSFDILELRPPGGLTVVVLEDLTRCMFREDDDEVAAYRQYFTHIWDAALDEPHSLELIEKVASRT